MCDSTELGIAVEDDLQIRGRDRTECSELDDMHVRCHFGRRGLVPVVLLCRVSIQDTAKSVSSMFLSSPSSLFQTILPSPFLDPFAKVAAHGISCAPIE